MNANATKTPTYPRRPLMLGHLTKEERAEADRRATEGAVPEAIDPAIWHPFCDAARLATPASDPAAASGYADGLAGRCEPWRWDGADAIVYRSAHASGQIDRETAEQEVREIARACSFEDCIVLGCRLEYGHEGKHDLSELTLPPYELNHPNGDPRWTEADC